MSDWRPKEPAIYTVTLVKAITDPGGEKTTKLPIWRRTKAKDYILATKRGIPEDSEARTVWLLSRVTGFHTEELEELDAFDFGRLSSLLNAFQIQGPGALIEKYVSGLLRPHSPESETPKISTTKT